MLAIRRVQAWALRRWGEVVVYLQSSALLRMYRDDGLVPGEYDIDVALAARSYGRIDGNIRRLSKTVDYERRQLSKDYGNRIVFNNIYKMGDMRNGYMIFRRKSSMNTGVQVSNMALDELSRNLCQPPRSSPLMTHRHTRDQIEREHGAFWFIRIQFKFVNVHQFYFWVNPDSNFHSHWHKMIQSITAMDRNNNGIISPKEVDTQVIKDGIDVVEYAKQISTRDKCRAAAMLTWLLHYNRAPYPIAETGWQGEDNGGDHPLFSFPTCDL